MKRLFLVCITSFCFASEKEELMRAIVRSDLSKVKKMLIHTDRLKEVVDSIGDTEEQLRNVAHKMIDVRNEKSALDKNAWYQNKHVQRIIGGSILITAGLLKGSIDIIYKGQEVDSSDEKAGVFSYDFLVDLGMIGWGGYYLINGALKRTPKLKLQEAERILQILQEKIGPKSEEIV